MCHVVLTSSASLLNDVILNVTIIVSRMWNVKERVGLPCKSRCVIICVLQDVIPSLCRDPHFRMLLADTSPRLCKVLL